MLTRTAGVLAVLLFFTASSLHADWHHQPAGKAVPATFGADSSGQTVFSSISGAGFWLTENGGAAWQPIGTRVSEERHVAPGYIIAVDAAADTLIMFTGFPYESLMRTLRSFDRGLTWGSIPGVQGQWYDVYAAHPRFHNLWFHAVGVPPAFYRSPDYGETWTQSPGFSFMAAQEIICDQADDSTLYCTGYYHAGEPGFPGLLRSTDMGTSWSPVTDFGQYGVTAGVVCDICRLSDGVLLLAMQSQSPLWESDCVMRSTDDGANWERITGSPMAGQGWRMVEIPDHPGRLFLPARCPGGLVRSDDFGLTWSPVSEGLPVEEPLPYGMDWNEFSHEMFVGYYLSGAYHSRDGGETWQPLNLPPVGTPWGWFRAAPEAVFAWVANESMPRAQWELASPYTEWHSLTMPTATGDSTYALGPVFEKHADTLWALAQIRSPDYEPVIHGRLLRSTDNGASWDALLTLPHEMLVDKISVFRSGMFLRLVVPVGYYGDTLMISEDRGDTWRTVQTAPNTMWWLQKLDQSENAIYVLSGEWYLIGFNQFFRTTDGGATWDSLNVPPGSYRQMALLGDDVYTVEYESHQVICWHEGEWQDRGVIPIEPGDRDWHLVSIPGVNLLLVSLVENQDSVWVSDDQGLNWTARDCEYPYSIQNLWLGEPEVDPYRQRIWITPGTGICYVDVGELVGSGTLHFKPAEYTLLSVYPNPFNGEARIRFDLDRAMRVSLRVYDLTGRLVETMVDEVRNAGRHELTFDGSDLASGTYFVHLRTDKGARTQKILLLK